MRIPTRLGRRLWLFARIVWRPWDKTPRGFYRLAWGTAWAVAKIVHD